LVLLVSCGIGHAAWVVEFPQPAWTNTPDSVPVLLGIQVPPALEAAIDSNHWQLVAEGAVPAALPLQYEPPTLGQNARLWAIAPGPPAAPARFLLQSSPRPHEATVKLASDSTRASYEIQDGGRPVLRYNHGTVPAPSGIPTQYVRGDYIMPLYGLDGEMLADDYPKDHPHHRGLSWSWPVTRWGREVRDIWAVSGVWARPAGVHRLQSGPVFALLEVENHWKWDDKTPIVRERVLIRAWRTQGNHRFLDIEIALTALVDDVAIGGRPHGGYGGFGLRAQPAEERVITRMVDPPQAPHRRSWLDYSGRFAGAPTPSGVAILEHPANPLSPNALLEYPELNYVMPAFPGEREVPLSRQQPLTLRHRVWIHRGRASTAALDAVWHACHQPLTATIRDTQHATH